MGCKDISKCNDCSSCSCDAPQEKTTYQIYKSHQKEDIQNYLRPKTKYGPQPNATPLDHPCSHWDYSGSIKRHQCLTCIREFVWAVGPEEARKEMLELQSVAQDRVEMAIKEYKYEFNLPLIEGGDE